MRTPVKLKRYTLMSRCQAQKRLEFLKKNYMMNFFVKIHAYLREVLLYKTDTEIAIAPRRIQQYHELNHNICFVQSNTILLQNNMIDDDPSYS